MSNTNSQNQPGQKNPTGSKETDPSKAPGRPKLDSVTDAPESGEPSEQAHRVIDTPDSSKTGSK